MAKPYCATCNNTGSIDCHCGGDLCVCGDEDIECPDCDPYGEFIHGFDDSEDEPAQAKETRNQLGQILSDALKQVSEDHSR
jgi:hypothetical protein